MPTVTINGVKHTPGSNTLKKMKKKAAAEAASKTTKPKAKKAKKVDTSEKPPIPAKRSMKNKVRVPKGPTMVGGKRGDLFIKLNIEMLFKVKKTTKGIIETVVVCCNENRTI